MILEDLKTHLGNYVKITRSITKKVTKISSGYILKYNSDFVLLQIAADFELLGYSIFPVSDVKKIRQNKYDKYFKKIMLWEGVADKVGINYDIDLGNWQSIFKSIQSLNLNLIIECEAPDIDTFTIGPVINITENQVILQNFDATGFLEDELVDIDFEDITNITFDTRYINVFSKYLRKKKAR